MARSEAASVLFQGNTGAGSTVPSLRRIMEMLDVYGLFGLKIDALPFGLFDTTAGSEIELQAVVAGKKADVALPITIKCFNYFSNITRRVNAGDTSKKEVTDLERFLNKRK